MQPKKSLGQNFLKDKNIASKIVDLLQPAQNELIIEIGPGQGILTEQILKRNFLQDFIAVEIDREAVEIIQRKFPTINIINKDILAFEFPQKPIALIGNLPYNISSSILFKVIENNEYINSAIFMLQKEVVERIVGKPGTKEYGILSILLGAYYQLKNQFTVSPEVFFPIPKVDSAVITLTKHFSIPDFNFLSLKKIVKTAFGQRRKMLSNALKILPIEIPTSLKNLRPEDLSITDYIQLSKQL